MLFRSCSRYLEIRKQDITGEASDAKTASVTVFRTVLKDLIAILHPFMPFITEEIREAIGEPEMLITGTWPAARPVDYAAADENLMTSILAITEAVRQIRGASSLSPAQALTVRVHLDDADRAPALAPHAWMVGGLEKIASLDFGGTKPPFTASALIPGGKVYVPLEGLLDPAAEKARLTKELEKARGFVASQEKKLGNEKFISGAPAHVITAERAKLSQQIDNVSKLEEALKDLG